MSAKINSNESVSSNDSQEEQVDLGVLIKYQELNKKCDVIIDKIKNRKSKKQTK